MARLVVQSRSGRQLPTGRLVILAVWLLQALISGFSGYFVSSRLQEQPGFQGQYRRDLRRFPTARGRRPFWLRNEVKRIG